MITNTERLPADALFAEGEGAALFSVFSDTIARHRMQPLLSRGVLVGFSGGADSVFLLLALREYAVRFGGFPIRAVHVHHGIRGEEADRDAAFAERFCQACDVPFVSRFADVPALARHRGIGMEEAARHARYAIFEDILHSENDVFCVAVAHQATDNLETVLFHMFRGAGTLGLCGIPPVRDRIVRPLIDLSSDRIRSLLTAKDVPFVTDTTNDSCAYTRNYIRKRIFPLLHKLSATPEVSVSRLSQNLRSDENFIQDHVARFLADHTARPIARDALAALHDAVLSRVLIALVGEVGEVAAHRTHLCAAMERIRRGDAGRVSFPGGIDFFCDGNVCGFQKHGEKPIRVPLDAPIGEGSTLLPMHAAAFFLSSDKNAKISSFVYNFSIQAGLGSAIIDGVLKVRTRREGDAYYYGGMTHKLKKLFNDRHISPALRDRIPVVYDRRGIVWVPGFGVRDDRRDGTKGGAPYLTFVSNGNAVGVAGLCAAPSAHQAKPLTDAAFQNKKGMVDFE